MMKQKIHKLLYANGQCAAQLNVPAALTRLQGEIDAGLRGDSGLPMLPALLSPNLDAGNATECIAIDIGGTNLRVCHVRYENGHQLLSDFRSRKTPGIDHPVTEEEFFREIMDFVALKDDTLPLACCYSFQITSLPGLDARPYGWCKEVKVTDVSGRTVAESIRLAAGLPKLRVAVVNDSVATMLAGLSLADKDTGLLGVIVGTGFNICCPLGDMIYNTEMDESDAYDKGAWDLKVFQNSQAPDKAHAEKQSSGKYLEELFRLGFQAAADAGLLSDAATYSAMPMPKLDALSGHPRGRDQRAVASIIGEIKKRSALLCAACTAALIKRMEYKKFVIVCEGSILNKMPGYKKAYLRSLGRLAPKRHILAVQLENPCLRGVAYLCTK